METDETRLSKALREHLRQTLDADTLARSCQPEGPVYGSWWQPGDAGTAAEAELAAIRSAKTVAARELANDAPNNSLEATAKGLMLRFGLPPHLHPRLRQGMMEAAVRAWEVVERRTLGVEDTGGTADPIGPIKPLNEPPSSPVVAPPAASKPPASSLVEAFFERRLGLDRTTHQVMGQDRGTLRRFIEVCGDKPPTDYTRADITGFLATLRQLPNSYGRSPKDKGRTVQQIIAEANAKNAERLTDKTVKRHLSALSQFFRHAVDAGDLSNAGHGELVDSHRFRETQAAKDQRDAWTSDDLVRLFTSPVWAGCQSANRRSTPGTTIIRDARFWLPLLALFHGARLEEFSDLYLRDVGEDDGIPFVRITETETRRLKTRNADRIVPLHPEIIRMGFLDYVEATARRPDDPLFPDIEPQGKDRKRGPRITRWFVEYRKAVGVYRAGVGMHAFRHAAITRLRDTITDHQQERHLDFLMGHARGGSEGRQRYDKGPQLRASAATLALLAYPELDLTGLHRLPIESVGEAR